MKKFFIAALIVSTLLKLIPLFSYNMPFTMDQGRDLVEVRQIWVNKDIKLIGPTTSINGVHLGPFYYYLISIPFLLFNGSPTSILVWQIFWLQSSIFCLFLAFYKKNKLLATVSAILLLFSPVGFYTSRYFWNASFTPGFILLFLIFFYKSLYEDNPQNDYLLGLLVGISLQLEAAFGIILLPFVILWLLIKKSTVPKYSRVIFIFFLTLLPQLIFELKHHFSMTKVLLGEFLGKSSILGDKLGINERLPQRWQVFKEVIRESSHLPFKYLFPGLIIVLLVGSFFLLKKKFTPEQLVAKRLFAVSTSLILFSVCFYLLYGSLLKNWYVFSLSSIICLSFSSAACLFIGSFPSAKNILFLFVVLSLVYAVSSQVDYLKSSFLPSNDPSGYKNQLSVIDDIYKHADGEGFVVYNYLPSIYDYPFQYLFWWYGKTKYGYMPNDLAYLPRQPEYIPERESFLHPTKPISSQSKTFLIIQKGDNKTHFQSWLGNFSSLCSIRDIKYAFSQQLLVLENCQK